MTVAAASRLTRGGSRVAACVDSAGRAYTMLLTPESFQFSGGGWAFTDIPRPGLYPLTYPQAPQIRTATFTQTLPPQATTKDRITVSHRLDAFQGLFDAAEPVRFVNVPGQLRGWWRIRALDITVDSLSGLQSAKSASIAWSLSAITQEPRPPVGQTPPPVKRSSKPPGRTTPGKTKSTPSYRVKAGDTLWKIAGSQLGNYSRWKEIAALNNLPDANQLTIGQLLKMPAR